MAQLARLENQKYSQASGFRPGWLGLRPGWLSLRPGWMAQRREWMDGQIDKYMDGQTDKQMDGWTDKRTDRKFPHSTGSLPCYPQENQENHIQRLK